MGPYDRTPGPDEIFLDCDDSYKGLPSKVKAACRWACDHGYEHIAKIDDDVVLNTAEFLASGFQNYEFVGHNNYDHTSVLIPWGFLYVLRQKSMEIVAGAHLPPNNNDEAWVARSLAEYGIVLHHEPRYHLYMGKRSDFCPNSPRTLRAPPRCRPVDPDTPAGGIAYCVYLNWNGFHETPHDVNIREYHKLYKETQQ